MYVVYLLCYSLNHGQESEDTKVRKHFFFFFLAGDGIILGQHMLRQQHL